MPLAPEIRTIIDSKAEQVLSPTVPILNAVRRRAAERQIASGIQGSAGDQFLVKAYFDFFKEAVSDFHATVLLAAEASHGWKGEELAALAEEKVGPFRVLLNAKIQQISSKKFSAEEPDLAAVHRKIGQSLLIELKLVEMRQARGNEQSPSTVNIHHSSGFQIGNKNTQQHQPTDLPPKII